MKKIETIKCNIGNRIFTHIIKSLLKILPNQKMPRHCSCCGVAGHTVSKCNDANAMSAMHDLFRDESIASAMGKVDSYPSNIVSFILSRGFGVPISGVGERRKRDALRTHVRRHFSSSREERLALIRTHVRTTQMIDNIRQIEYNAMLAEEQGSLTNYNVLKIVTDAFDYNTPGLIGLLATHPYYQFGVNNNSLLISQMMKLLVKQVLDLMYEESRRTAVSASQAAINRKLKERLDNTEGYCELLKMYGTRCHLVLSPYAIAQMLRLSRMYNYKRVSERGSSFNFINTNPTPVSNDVMKSLAIQVVLELDDEKTEKEECSVCFDELSREKIVKTGCNHVFCSGCVAGVAKTRGIKSFIRCPCCRADMDQLTVGCQEEHTEIIKGLAPVAI